MNNTTIEIRSMSDSVAFEGLPRDMANSYGLLSLPEGVRATILPHRACESCKKKKTKCDMRRPICSLCRRTGQVCVFPTERKRPRSGKQYESSRKRSRVGAEPRATQFSAGSQGSKSDSSSGSRRVEPPEIPTNTASQPQAEVRDVESWTFGPEDYRHQDLPQLTQGLPEFCSLDTRLIDIPGESLEHLPENDVLSDDLLSGFLWQSPESALDHDFLAPSNHEVPAPNSGHSTNWNEDPGFANGDDDAEKSITLIVSASTARSLIETYFEDVHACFPIINQPTFMASLPDLLGVGEQHPTLSLDQGLLIYSMMALSSRFSRLPEFSHVSPSQRGRDFARRSGKIISQLLMDSELDKASITFLHGCSLAAAYWLACGPNGKAWFLVGICVRMAYSLSLHTIDDDLRDPEARSLSSSEWTRREGLRRTWWLVVECDNFASVVRCRPLSIDRSRMHVLLPCRDEYWFSETPCTSAFLDNDVQRSWTDLKSSSNKNPHAWYLIVNQLMVRGHEMSLNPRRSVRDQLNLQDLIQAVAMSLPEEFSRTRGTATAFEEGSIGHDNWVVALHLMLQSARVYVVDSESDTLEADESPDSLEDGVGNPPQTFFAGEQATLQIAPQKYRPMLNAMLRATRTWPPDCCVTCQPFQVCTLLGPYASHLQATFFAPSTSRGALERDLIHATIAQIAKYWEIGSATLELMDALTTRFSSSLKSDTTTATTRSATTSIENDQKLRCLLPL